MSCALRLDDEAVRVVVGLRLGSNLCVPHQCQCGSLVTAHGLHSYICKKAPSSTSRHHALNDLAARAFASAAIPVAKEPQGLSRADGKRPDGLTTVPWREGKPLTWDVCPSATNAGSAAEATAIRKAAKFTGLERTRIFQPVAVENLGTMNASAYGFLAGLGQKQQQQQQPFNGL